MKHLLLQALLHGTLAIHGVDTKQPQQPFGKTHFILGCPATRSFDTSKNQDAPKQQHPTQCRAYFSPHDNIKQHLIDLITHEKQSIKVSVYTFTDKEIAAALIEAQKRGVAVEVITDGSASKDKFSKIAYLNQAGIRVCVYEPKEEGLINNIMHHKFVLFGKNKDDKPLLWTGSYNFTKSANIKNQENVVVLDDPHIVDQYLKQFERLKTIIQSPRSVNQKEHTIARVNRKKQNKKNDIIS